MYRTNAKPPTRQEPPKRPGLFGRLFHIHHWRVKCDLEPYWETVADMVRKRGPWYEDPKTSSMAHNSVGYTLRSYGYHGLGKTREKAVELFQDAIVDAGTQVVCEKCGEIAKDFGDPIEILRKSGIGLTTLAKLGHLFQVCADKAKPTDEDLGIQETEQETDNP